MIGQHVVSAVQKGNTALHYVCQRKSRHLVHLLLERNSDINIRNHVRTEQHDHIGTQGALSLKEVLTTSSSTGWRDAARHRSQIEVQQDRQHAEEDALTETDSDRKTCWFTTDLQIPEVS